LHHAELRQRQMRHATARIQSRRVQ
jgi:hypothetical protein